MKKLILIFVSVLLVVTGITADYEKKIDRREVEEKILETVMVVEGASGITVYSTDNYALVLTSYHVIEENLEETACTACQYNINIYVLNEVSLGDVLVHFPQIFEVVYVDVDEKNDLALILIKVPHKLDYAKINKDKLVVGKDIYLASNPSNTYRSLKKGIISSTLRNDDTTKVLEVDAGVIFGSSGGGAFSMDGRLVGSIRSVKVFKTNYCFKFTDEEENVYDECIQFPLPFMGFVVPNFIIKDFLLDGIFSEYFRYLN